MKFEKRPTDEEIEALKESGEIVYHYLSESGLGTYEAFLQLPSQQTQEYIFKQIGTDKFTNAVDSTKDEVILWCNPLTSKSFMGLVGAYSDFFQKASPMSFGQQKDS